MNTYDLITQNFDELYHHGIKGQRWGIRRFQNPDGTFTEAGKKRYGVDSTKKKYNPTGIRSAIAKRKNRKVDKGFEQWKENDKKKEEAINLGKKAMTSKVAYELNKKNKDLKNAYKSDNKEYKKALGQNTTYRKGAVKQEVGKSLSRKYLSEAKKVEKMLAKDPGNSDLKKQYNGLMSKYGVARAKARRASEVGVNRMKAKASVKRSMTLRTKAIIGTGATVAGVAAVNYVLTKKNVKLNGRDVRFSGSDMERIKNFASIGKKYMGIIH